MNRVCVYTPLGHVSSGMLKMDCEVIVIDPQEGPLPFKIGKKKGLFIKRGSRALNTSVIVWRDLVMIFADIPCEPHLFMM